MHLRKSGIAGNKTKECSPQRRKVRREKLKEIFQPRIFTDKALIKEEKEYAS